MVSSLIPHAPGLQFSMIFRSPRLNQPHPPRIPPPFPFRGKAHVTILLLSRWKLLSGACIICPLHPLTWYIPPPPNPVCFPPQGGHFRMLEAGPFPTTPHLSNLNSLVGSQVQHDCLREIFPKRKSGPSATYSVAFFFFYTIAFITTDGYIYFVVINSKTITLNGDSPLWSRWFKSKVYPQRPAHNKHFYTSACYLQPHFFYE